MNKFKTALKIFSLSLLNYFIFVQAAVALSQPPQFPSCLNPQGTLKVSYTSGTHGVPGKTEAFSGSDSVYTLEQNSLIQCLCPTGAKDGIQTNWWKIPSLTSADIENFKTQGWIFIPDGLAWGLDPVAYLAKNINYTCRTSAGVGGGEVLGLAATGNILTIYTLILAGSLSLTIGYLLRQKQT